MGVTVNGAVLGQAWRVLAAVCLCWICAGEALAQGICAEVRLRISQEAVMTRSAFKATLELANNSSTATVDNAGVDIYISTWLDCSMPDGNDLFAGDDTPQVSGFDHGSTGVLITGGTARFEWLLIPSRLAAPEGPTQYYIGGVLRYNEDGVERSTPLLPALVTVHPEAALELDYFQVRDVPGDDAMTENVVEPSDPFPLGLIVRNTGRGQARNLSIASAQPEIVENEKGLLVDFRITGAKVGAEAAKPSLTVALGDILPGGTKVAEWTMLCSLMGTFREYTASFTHRNDTGTTGMSLIESVRVHELAHSMLIPGEDAIPDFLANDETGGVDGLPDTIYSSQGGVPLPVSPYTSQGDIGRITFAGTVGQSPVTTMTALAMPSGWVYLRADNPAGKSAYELKSVSRDGVALPVPQNAWTSRFTRHDDTHTTHENFIHVVDYRAVQGSRVYTLVFAEPSQEPRVSVSPDAVQFAALVVGKPPAEAQTVTVTNTSAVDVAFTAAGAQIAGGDAVHFRLVEPDTSPLPAGQSREFHVVFDPESEGVKLAVLRIETTAAETPVINVALQGTARPFVIPAMEVVWPEDGEAYGEPMGLYWAAVSGGPLMAHYGVLKEFDYDDNLLDERVVHFGDQATTEGKYELTAYGMNTDDNWGTSPVTRFSLDYTDPVASIDEPLDDVTTRPAFTITGTLLDAGGCGIGSGWYSVNAGGTSMPWTNLTPVAGGFAFTQAVELSEGPNTIYAQCNDRAGNPSNVAQAEVLLDSPPAMAIDEPTSYTWSNKPLAMRWHCDDEDLATSRGVLTRTDEAGTTQSAEVQDGTTVTETGWYWLDVYGTDARGTESGAVSTSFCIETTPPVVMSITRMDANPTSAGAVRFRVEFDEAITTLPAESLAAVGTGVSAVLGAITGGPTTWTVQLTGVTGNGLLGLDVATTSALLTDLAGNALETTATGEKYTVDQTVPEISGVSATPALAKLGAAVTLTFGVSEPLAQTPVVTVNGRPASYVSHTEGGTYTYEFVVSAADTDGQASVAVTAQDLACNTGSRTEGSVLEIDRTAPVMAIDRPTSFTWHTSVPVELVWYELRGETVTSGGVLQWTGFDMEESETDAASNDAVSSEGVYLLGVMGTDAAGNDSETTLTSFGVDMTSPVVTLDVVTETLSTSSLAVDGAAWEHGGLESGVAAVLYRMDEGEWTTHSLHGGVRLAEFRIVLDNLDMTTHALEVRGIDKAGNVSAVAGMDVRIDAEPPQVVLTTTAGSHTSQSPVTATAVFSEPVVGFELEDVVVTNGSADGLVCNGTVCTFQVAAADQGEVAVTIPGGVCTDFAGNANVAVAVPLVYLYDTAAPVVMDLASSPAWANIHTGADITFRVSEELSGLPAVTVNGVPAVYVECVGGVYKYHYTVTAANPHGAAVVAIACTDAIGNCGVTENAEAVFIDRSGISCELPCPAPPGTLFDAANPVPGCMPSTDGFWLVTEVPPLSSVAISGFAARVCIALYDGCNQTPLDSFGQSARPPAVQTMPFSNYEGTTRTILSNVSIASGYGFISVTSSTLPQGLGAGCDQPIPVACGSHFYTGHDELPGTAGNDRVPGSYARGLVSKWLSVDVASYSTVTVSMTLPGGRSGWLAFYARCGELPVKAVNGYAGSVAASFGNDSGRVRSVLVLVAYDPAGGSPELTVACQSPGTCANAQQVVCGQTVTGGLMSAAGNSTGPCVAETLPSRWFYIDVPEANTAITATLDDRSQYRDARGPSIAQDDKGHLACAWSSSGGYGSQSRILLSTSLDTGAAWSMPRVLSASQIPAHDWEPSIAADGNGTWVCAWTRSAPSYRRPAVNVARSLDFGMTWTAGRLVYPGLDTDNYEDSVPVVVSCSGSRWLAAWRAIRSGSEPGPRRGTRISRSLDGARSWSQPAFIGVDDSGHGGMFPSLATDRHGNCLILLCRYDSVGSDIVCYNSADDGQTWSGPAEVTTQTVACYLPPHVVYDGNGGWLAAWSADWSAENYVWTARSVDNGNTWGAHALVSTSGTLGYSAPRLAVGTTGSALLVWPHEYYNSEMTGYLCDVLAAQSADSGVTWIPVSPVAAGNAVFSVGNMAAIPFSGGNGSWHVLHDMGDWMWHAFRLGEPGAVWDNWPSPAASTSFLSLYSGQDCGGLTLRDCQSSTPPHGTFSGYYKTETANERVYIQAGTLHNDPNQQLTISCFEKLY